MAVIHDELGQGVTEFPEVSGKRVVPVKIQEMPDVTVSTSTLPTGAATSANQTSTITELQVLNSLIPTKYDYIALSYTGANLTGVVFKLGGSGGTTAATLTLAYTGSNLTSVTKT